MSSITAIASSGLRAAQQRLDASAHNIANAQTPGMRPLRVEQAEAATPPGGVRTSVQRASQPGVALEQEMVDQMSATYAFKANLRTLQTQDRMLGALLNEQA
ncbi:flagellar basal body rod protein FlgC [Comamonas granuli]|uniref:flagellar basal body rod protein FlgC n=1 Tax=Comamonas granuli TaxID=290309 RepID=UPI0005A92C90|nr:flagellar basal body rod C-terminal domain-containing protein [Comamonas granuli]